MSFGGDQREGPGEIDEQERFVQDEEQKPIVEVEGIPGKEREEP
jgi:hypothetical protein